MKRTCGVMVALGAATLSVSCGADGRQFVAVESDFAGYATWHCVPLGSAPLAGHPTGERVACINHAPPMGATEYPAGTIIVKEIHSDPDPSLWELFAMVKTGGTYNASGAAGWEFFLLAPGTHGDPSIRDRGLAPSLGDPYAASTASGCNGCHGSPASATTDHVLDAALRLGN